MNAKKTWLCATALAALCFAGVIASGCSGEDKRPADHPKPAMPEGMQSTSVPPSSN